MNNVHHSWYILYLQTHNSAHLHEKGPSPLSLKDPILATVKSLKFNNDHVMFHGVISYKSAFDIGHYYVVKILQSICRSGINRRNLGVPGPPFTNIKILSYQYRKSHCGDKMVVRSSYLHNGISYTGKTTSLYWIRTLIFKWVAITSFENGAQGAYSQKWLDDMPHLRVHDLLLSCNDLIYK